MRLQLECLESRETPSSNRLFALAQDGSSIVAVYESAGPVGVAGAPTSLEGTGRFLRTINAYPGATGGVRVALGDVTGDGIEDLVTVPGPAAGQKIIVNVYDGAALLSSQETLVAQFTAMNGIAGTNGLVGGAYVAVGQIDPSSFAKEIVIGSGYGRSPLVQVFNGNGGGPIREFVPYAASFGGGVRVASTECSGDLADDIITAAGPGGGPHVRIFNGQNPAFIVDEFFAFDSTFTGGVYVAAGELDGVANRGDIATGAGEGGGPHVKVWCAAPGQRYFTKAQAFVNDPNNRSGVRVGVANLDRNPTQQSLYTGEGSEWVLNRFPGSNNAEPRLRSYRMNAYIGLVPTDAGGVVGPLTGGIVVQPGTFNANSLLKLERISLQDPYPAGRAGGLFIGV